MKTPRPLSVYLRALALAAHLALIVVLPILVPTRLGLASALLLCLPLWGLVRGSLYTGKWASMLLVFYCALLLAGGYADPAQRRLLFGLATLAAIDFSALVLYVRFASREALAQRHSLG